MNNELKILIEKLKGDYDEKVDIRKSKGVESSKSEITKTGISSSQRRIKYFLKSSYE